MSKLTFYQQASSPGTPVANKANVYVDNLALPRLQIVSPAGGSFPLAKDVSNMSTSTVSAGYASETYLAGSCVTIDTGTWRVGTNYYCLFDMVKTGAGTAAFSIAVKMGTLGTTGDATILTLAFAVGTAVIDTGLFEVYLNFRTVGSGTSAVVQGTAICKHHLAATGLITTGASGVGIIIGTSSGFNSTTQTKLGLTVNGGSSFSGTNTLVQTQLFGI